MIIPRLLFSSENVSAYLVERSNEMWYVEVGSEVEYPDVWLELAGPFRSIFAATEPPYRVNRKGFALRISNLEAARLFEAYPNAERIHLEAGEALP